MRKIIKITLITIVSLLLLAFVGVFIFLQTLDTDTIKQQVSEQFYQATGRTISLDGTLSFSIFPNIAAKVSNITIGNPSQLESDTPFITLDNAALSVKLLPLLRKDIQVQQIILEKPHINLLANSNGNNNWSDWGDNSANDNAAVTQNITNTDTAVDSHSSDSDMKLSIAIKTIRVKDGSVMLNDQQTKQQLQVSGLNIDLTDLVASSDQNAAEQDNHFTFKGNIAITQLAYTDPDKTTQLQVNNLAMQFPNTAASVTMENDALKASILVNGKISLDNINETHPQADAFSIDKLELLVNNLKLYTENSNQQQTYQASLQDSQLSLQQLTSTHESGKANLNSLQLAIPNLSLYLANSAQQNNISVDMNGKLAIDKLSYLNPDEEQDVRLNKIELELDNLKLESALDDTLFNIFSNLNMLGKLNIQQASNNLLTLTAINTDVNAHDGITEIKPIQANFEHGNYNGELTINTTQTIPRLTTNHKLTNIQLATLTLDEEGNPQLDGLLNADLNLTANGNDVDSIKRNLNGKAQFDIRNGIVYGVDFNHIVNSGVALLGGRTEPSDNTEKTKFDSLTGSFNIHNGVADNNDLLLLTPIIRATGRGNANLVTDQINYQLEAEAVRYIKDDQGKTLIESQTIAIPATITGSLTDPKFALDTAKLLSNIGQDVITRGLQGLLGGNKQQDQQKNATQAQPKKEEAKIEDVIGGALDSIFGRK